MSVYAGDVHTILSKSNFIIFSMICCNLLHSHHDSILHYHCWGCRDSWFEWWRRVRVISCATAGNSTEKKWSGCVIKLLRDISAWVMVCVCVMCLLLIGHCRVHRQSWHTHDWGTPFCDHWKLRMTFGQQAAPNESQIYTLSWTSHASRLHNRIKSTKSTLIYPFAASMIRS